ncbi:MAG: NGG1p interacting factor NIF3 [Methylococcaceae bacterium]|nr:NGG1p interacting factor NIF3 [Methylococcaceae bacterium]
MYKLCFYVPESHLQAVKEALFMSGAGRYKAYDNCSWQVRGEGQFRPLSHSNPFIGQCYQLEEIVEFKVEMVCEDNVIHKAVDCLLNTHPYEEPAYEVYKILTIDDL